MLTWQAHTHVHVADAPGAVTSLAFVPGGGLLSTGTDGVVRHWDSTTGSMHHFWKLVEGVEKPTNSNLVRVLSDSTGRYAAVGLRHEGIDFFDLVNGDNAGHARVQHVEALVAGPDGQSVFVLGVPPTSGSPLTCVCQFKFPDGEELARTKTALASYHLGGLAIRPDGMQVVVGAYRFAWPAAKLTGSSFARPPRGQLAVSPDGDKLFEINGARLMVWGLQVGAVRQKLKGHLATITGLTATPDGRKLWTCSADATVRQWDVETYRCTQCYGLKIGPLGCVAVSPDGLTAAAGSAHNGHIAVWDLD